MTRTASHPASAFTLIELMVVLVLISIVTALMIGEMRGTFEDALLRSTARTLVGAVSLASARAVSISQPHRLRLNPVSGQFQIERSTYDEWAGQKYLPISEIPGAEGTLDTRIQLTMRLSDGVSDPADSALGTNPPEADTEAVPREPNVISFFPDGTCDAVEIMLKDRDGVRLGLRLNPITCRVTLAELAKQ